MYYSLCLRTLYSVSIYMTHYIMSYLLFSLKRHIKVYIIFKFFQFFYLFVGYIKTEFFFGLRQRNPQSSPRFELLILRKNILHLCTCISFTKRAYISVSQTCLLIYSKSSEYFGICVFHSAKVSSESILIKLFMCLLVPKPAGIR